MSGPYTAAAPPGSHDMVKQLIYKSQSDETITPEMVDEIIMHAQRYNDDHGITGLLLFSEDTFMQFLEGAPEDIDRVFQRICEDKRHQKIRTLYIGYADERAYANWKMAACSTEHLLHHGNSRGFVLASTLMGATADDVVVEIGEFMQALCDEYLPLPKPDLDHYN